MDIAMAHDVDATIRNSIIKDGAFSVLRDMDTSPSEAEYTEWLRVRLEKTIKALDSGEMKSYSSETAKAVLHAHLEARRGTPNLPDSYSAI